MPKLEGRASAVIGAPIDLVFDIASDAEGAPRWQPELKLVTAVERDGDGRQALVETETDLKVRTMKARIRFHYRKPHRIDWVQEEGDVAGVEGSWTFAAVGEEATEATCKMTIDLGRILGMAVRGPVADLLRKQLIETMPKKLKSFVEGGPEAG